MQLPNVTDRPWIQFYPLQPDFNEAVRTLADDVEQHAKERPSAPAAEFLGITLSYADLNRWGNQLANALLKRGLQHGETIGMHLPNTPQYLIGLIAASKLGCPVTGVSPLLTTSELEYQLQDADARFLITLDQLYTAAVLPADGRLNFLRGIFVTGAIDFLPGWKQQIAYLLRKVPRPNWQSLNNTKTEAFMPAVKHAANTPVHTDIADDATVLIQYTGGTTGKPKGAELSNSNMFFNAVQAKAFMAAKPGDTFASAFPLFHQAGLAIALMSLRTGARQLLIPNPRDTDHFAAQLKKFPPTIIGNVPTLYQMLLENPDFRTVDFSQLRTAFSGAAPFAPESIRHLEEFIGVGKLCEGYGMTETSPMISINPPGRAKPGTVGIPVPGSDVKIVNTETGDEEMPQGEPGEVIACGPHIMKGYRGLSEESAKAIRIRDDGQRWMYTGDIGFLDADGYLTICDRAKDMLIVGGYKVFSVEVESKLQELPFIELCALVGLPDAKRPGNEIVKLWVQLTADAKNDDESGDESNYQEKIIEFCRTNMAPYKVPKHIAFLDELPLTAVGKLDKKVLRK